MIIDLLKPHKENSRRLDFACQHIIKGFGDKSVSDGPVQRRVIVPHKVCDTSLARERDGGFVWPARLPVAILHFGPASEL